MADLKQENGRSNLEYIVQKKNWLGRWKEVMSTEVSSRRIAHKTYADAEAYMLAEYMGHGICEKIGIEYHYTPYTYYV